MAGALVVAAPAAATRTAPAAQHCTLEFSGPRWTIRGSGSGTAYKLAARGISCTVARTWVRKLAALKNNPGGGGTFHGGPAGFTCRSLSVPASGDKLIYAGACVHSPGVPFFGWSAKPA